MGLSLSFPIKAEKKLTLMHARIASMLSINLHLLPPKGRVGHTTNDSETTY